MDIKENKDYLYATRITRLTSFLETNDEKIRFRTAIYNAIMWGKTH